MQIETANPVKIGDAKLWIYSRFPTVTIARPPKSLDWLRFLWAWKEQAHILLFVMGGNPIAASLRGTYEQRMELLAKIAEPGMDLPDFIRVNSSSGSLGIAAWLKDFLHCAKHHQQPGG
jgi:hypothetical protein